ncbi:MAG TPA: ATP-binding cassette domain-containing protein [Propionibacteriaceae bacterium]|nr:ATP-binding cassette domain-containing protein [Propionibacteriaceae bacterium]
MTSAVHLEDVSYSFGDHRAVDGVSLDISAGECFGLLGPNGAGKTTLIRLMNTLLPLQSGTIEVFGHSVRHHKTAVRRLMGYVPQQLSIEAALTGRENVMWFARLYDIPRRERRDRVEEALAMVDLQDSAGRLASTYSGGMVRRLELAQALVNRPALLVLDEPTVGLDPNARDSVWERVAEMQREQGTTVIVTTHYMEEADALCDRVALLNLGKLAVVGTPDALKAQLGPEANLEDVFRHYSGSSLDDHAQRGGLSGVRSSRTTARRLG